MGKMVAVLVLGLLVAGCVVREGPYRPHYSSGPVYIERAPAHRYYDRPPPPHYRYGPPRPRYHHHRY